MQEAAWGRVEETMTKTTEAGQYVDGKWVSDFRRGLDVAYRSMALSPQLARGQVWCLTCGATQKIDSADCLRTGWPKCCGTTMSISSPEEQK